MNISVATATFWFLPFEQVIEIIVDAGFEYIELDLFRENSDFGMAQHLRDTEPEEVLKLIRKANLKVSVIHDGWGVLDDSTSIEGFVNPQLSEFLYQLGYAPDCIAFHTPHIKGDYDERWWQSISGEIAEVAKSYKTDQTVVTIENMPLFDSYYVPLSTPEELMAFVLEHELDVTMDVTHYPQIGIDLLKAARVLRKRVKTLHLSDYLDGKTHLFIGDGNIDFVQLFRILDLSVVRSATLEYMVAPKETQISPTEQADMIKRLKTAKNRLQDWIDMAHRDRGEPHNSPLPPHAAYGSVLRESADQAESDPGEHKPK